MVNYYKIGLNDIMVIHDDLDMSFGRVKFVNNSSNGGIYHKISGKKAII